MHDYSDCSIRMKKRFAKAKTSAEKQQIVDNFIKKLRNDGLSNKEIERIAIAQGNREMISNTEAYKKALKKALGDKNYIKKTSKKSLGEKNEPNRIFIFRNNN